jgi:NitT/TauT family transport system ATP-binding protein
MPVHIRRLAKAFDGPGGPVRALDDLSFSVADGELVAIVGPSGCGKTTLLRLVAGLIPPSAGQVAVEPSGGTPARVALVFQEHGLFPWLTVLDNVAFGLEARGAGRAERRRRAGAFLDRIGLGAFGRHYPYQLSAGMRQRVAIARAFLLEPTVLLLDEPFGALDAQTTRLMHEELLALCREYRPAVIYVTHDIDDALALADRVVVMSGRPGRILDTIPLAGGRPHAGDGGGRFEEIKWRIWTLLEREVRESLGLGGASTSGSGRPGAPNAS